MYVRIADYDMTLGTKCTYKSEPDGSVPKMEGSGKGLLSPECLKSQESRVKDRGKVVLLVLINLRIPY